MHMLSPVNSFLKNFVNVILTCSTVIFYRFMETFVTFIKDFNNFDENPISMLYASLV